MNMLLDYSTRHSLALWRALGRGQRGVFAIMRGDNMSGLALWRSSLDEVGDAGFALQIITFLGWWASAVGQTGRVDKELAEIDAVIDRSRQTEEGWLIAELLRIKGKLLLLQGASGAARSGEQLFRQALDWARRQGALSWELRTAASLARLLRDQGRSAEALALFQPVYNRFTEGFETADLKAAKVLLDALHT
jgi:predicted ATPase